MFQETSMIRSSRERELHEMRWFDKVVPAYGWDMHWSYGQCPSCHKMIGEYSHVMWGGKLFGICPACGREVLVYFTSTAFGSRPEGQTPPTSVDNDAWEWAVSYEMQFKPYVKYFPAFWEAADFIAENGLKRAGLQRNPTRERLQDLYRRQTEASEATRVAQSQQLIARVKQFFSQFTIR
jgi:hypothetical protein